MPAWGSLVDRFGPRLCAIGGILGWGCALFASSKAHGIQQLHQIMVASYNVKGDTFVAEKPRVWIAKLGAPAVSGQQWDLAPDGKRVVVLTPVESAEAPRQDHQIVILQRAAAQSASRELASLAAKWRNSLKQVIRNVMSGWRPRSAIHP